MRRVFKKHISKLKITWKKRITKAEVRKLDILWSYVVKLRDEVCQKTGRTKNQSILHACHYITRSNRQTRWLLDNGVTFIAGVHRNWCHKHFHEFEEFMKRRLGNRFELLLLAKKGHQKFFYEDVNAGLLVQIEKLKEKNL